MSNNVNNKYFIGKISNGLRVVVEHTRSFVSYIGVAVNAGSRDEDPSTPGLAHFVEHTIFKGTTHRNSWHISNRMESLGGELNAYTSKEETLIYTNSPAGHAERAIELLADIIANSIFPPREIEKEREVVIEEINSYLDSPADSIFDDFEELIYAGSGLSHNILGNPQSVRNLAPANCRAFLDTFYTPQNMVIYAAGPDSPETIMKFVEKHFGALHYPAPASRRTPPPPCKGFDEVRDRNGHQAHTIVGFHLFGREDQRRFPLFLLNNYLGGPCMNSRLNHELREKRGLVYTVDSNVALLSDTGIMQVYFGCDPEATGKCISLIENEIHRLASTTLSPTTFNAILNQYCGQLLVSTDQRESMAMSLAKSIMYYSDVHDVKEVTERMRAVTPQALREVAQMLAESPRCRLTIK